jgi:hypothetical protein
MVVEVGMDLGIVVADVGRVVEVVGREVAVAASLVVIQLEVQVVAIVSVTECDNYLFHSKYVCW